MTQTVSRIQEVTLYNREGGAAKQYTLWLEKQGTGYVVQFQFGPIGGWLQGGTKTKAPVDQAAAQKVYDKLITEKRAKGYAVGANAPAFSQTPNAVDTGLRPMLLTPDTEENMESYLKDPEWAIQEKMNGKRIMLKALAGKAIGVNRRGLECPLPQALMDIPPKFIVTLDGELIGDTYHAFDVLEDNGADLRKKPMEERFQALEKVVKQLKHPNIRVVSLLTEEKAKRNLVKQLKNDNKEGVVFKDIGAEYEPGRRENLKKALQVKVKFWSEADLMIVGWNKDKASVNVAAAEGEDHGSHYDTFTPVSVGNVTVPDKYASQIVPNKALRVKYLYATDANQLYQPRVDPTDDGQVVREPDWDGRITKVADLKHEGKD